jgi:hypothetical protein
MSDLYACRMKHGWAWAAVLAVVAVVLLMVGLVMPAGTSINWRAVAELVIGLSVAVTTLALVARDSAARGRSPWGWVIACVFLAPLAIPVFLIVAVYDRLRGRVGIESRWAPGGRWLLLSAIALAMTAAVVAGSTVQVPSMSVSVPGSTGYYSGSCGSALSVVLGNGTYAPVSPAAFGGSKLLATAQSTVAGDCLAAADDRMTDSAILLGTALLLALAGLAVNRRRERVSSST